MDELAAIEEWAGSLLSQLTPAARRDVMVDIGRELRRSQQARIKAQANPDGSAYEPRKPQLRMGKALREKVGRVKKKAMFARIRTAKFLKIEATGEGLAIGFAARAAHVARVHQYGETEQVARGGPRYKYPARVLLGFTAADRDMILDKLLSHLVK